MAKKPGAIKLAFTLKQDAKLVLIKACEPCWGFNDGISLRIGRNTTEWLSFSNYRRLRNRGQNSGHKRSCRLRYSYLIKLKTDIKSPKRNLNKWYRESWVRNRFVWGCQEYRNGWCYWWAAYDENILKQQKNREESRHFKLKFRLFGWQKLKASNQNGEEKLKTEAQRKVPALYRH